MDARAARGLSEAGFLQKAARVCHGSSGFGSPYLLSRQRARGVKRQAMVKRAQKRVPRIP